MFQDIELRDFQEENEMTDRAYEITLKVLALVGLLVLLFGAAWASTRLLRYVPETVSSLANSFSAVTSTVFPFERIEVAASSSTVESGVPFTLSWRHIRKDSDGSYSLFYPCAEGFYLSAQTLNGNYAVSCNTPFNFVNTNNSIVLTAVSNGLVSVEMPISIQFTKNRKERAHRVGGKILTVVNPDISSEEK